LSRPENEGGRSVFVCSPIWASEDVAARARERQQATLKQISTAKENLPERVHGKSRDLAGKALRERMP